MVLVVRIIDGAAMKGRPSEGGVFLQAYSSQVQSTGKHTIFLQQGFCEARVLLKNSRLSQKRMRQILASHSSWKLKLSRINLSISPCKANGPFLPYGPHDSYCPSSLGAKYKLSVKIGNLKISVAGDFPLYVLAAMHQGMIVR